MAERWIGIEAGGTKVVCAHGSGPDDLSAPTRIPTTTPEETLRAIVDWVRWCLADGDVAGIGLASFGPLDLDPESPTYGHLTTTPKPGWAGADLLGPLREVFDGPIAIDTDVNGAALGEVRWGAGADVPSLAYVTIGTGVGVGAIVEGAPLHGLLHPEAGHILVRRHPDDPFAGRCPSHGDCLEGLACGPAWLDRWGVTSEQMDPETLERAVSIQASYLGQLVGTLVLVLSPHRIVFGGGVMGQPGLLARTRAAAAEVLNGYVDVPALTDGMDRYLLAPGLGDRAGVLGAIALAQRTRQ